MATTAGRRFCRCACFCSQNLYVARYGLHLRFRDEQRLRRDYGPVSEGRRRGPDTRTGFARGLSLQHGSSLEPENTRAECAGQKFSDLLILSLSSA